MSEKEVDKLKLQQLKLQQENKQKEYKQLKQKIKELKKKGVVIRDKYGRTLENKFIKFGVDLIIELVLIYSWSFFYHYICLKDFIFGAVTFSVGMWWLIIYEDKHFSIRDYYEDKLIEREESEIED